MHAVGNDFLYKVYSACLFGCRARLLAVSHLIMWEIIMFDILDYSSTF